MRLFHPGAACVYLPRGGTEAAVLVADRRATPAAQGPRHGPGLGIARLASVKYGV